MTVVETQVPEGYRVELGVFHGPLDLLLHLIRKDEVDICDIPISRITRQYLQYIEMIQSFNLEIAGEFILMAATLIRIKTRMLLPRNESDPDEIDPREELVLALIEYRKYREAAEMLRERALMEERNYVPPSPVGKVKGRVDLAPATSLFDLMTAFQDVLKARRDETFHHVNARKVSIEERIQHILGFLADHEHASFVDLFNDAPRKVVAVVTFIAMLELVRAHRIKVMQSVPFAELRIYRGQRFAANREAIDLIDHELEVERLVHR